MVQVGPRRRQCFASDVSASKTTCRRSHKSEKSTTCSDMIDSSEGWAPNHESLSACAPAMLISKHKVDMTWYTGKKMDCQSARCKIIQRHLPCLHPALFRLLGNSVLLGLDGFVRFWSECLGEMFVVPCYLSTFHIIITCKANEATNIHWLTFSVGASTSKLSWASLASAAITCNFTAHLRREK